EFPEFSCPGSVFLWPWCVSPHLRPKTLLLRSLWTPTSHLSTSTPSSQSFQRRQKIRMGIVWPSSSCQEPKLLYSLPKPP
ncbi:hypothetical protein LDENG_00052940, partial [Lucifuga dentata]